MNLPAHPKKCLFFTKSSLRHLTINVTLIVTYYIVIMIYRTQRGTSVYFEGWPSETLVHVIVVCSNAKGVDH